MKDINDILAKHFSGGVNPEEAKLVADWKRANEEEYAILAEAWQTADDHLLKGLEFKTFDQKGAWEKVDAKLVDEKEIKVIKMKFYRNVAAACAILLVGLAGFWFLNRTSFESVSNTAGTPKEISLPDGSKVWLASNSTLEYNSDFENERALNLEGEAFFDVARDEAHPFIISTEFGEVEVLGTAFNIEVEAEGAVVSVEHGKVAVRNDGGEVKLTAGESATATNSGVSDKAPADLNYQGWKTGSFNFYDTPLSDVVEILNKHYETEVILDNKDKANDLVTGTFKNADIDDIIEVIVLTCDVEEEKDENIIRLK